MRKIQTVGLALVAMFALSAFVASSAFGASEWLNNGAAITAAIKVASKGKLKLSDSKGGLFGEKVEIECEGTDEGTVGPGTADTVTKITATKCVRITGICPETITATALHLPWKTTLLLVEEKWRDDIENSGAGAPGWNVVCSGTVEDECTAETSTELKNVTGGVEAIFDAKSAKANCTRGGTGAGTVLGNDLNANPTGDVITVS